MLLLQLVVLPLQLVVVLALQLVVAVVLPLQPVVVVPLLLQPAPPQVPELELELQLPLAVARLHLAVLPLEKIRLVWPPLPQSPLGMERLWLELCQQQWMLL